MAVEGAQQIHTASVRSTKCSRGLNGFAAEIACRVTENERGWPRELRDVSGDYVPEITAWWRAALHGIFLRD